MHKFFALALGGMWFFGCAVKSPPVALYGGVPPTESAKATIGVIPFDDLRPDEQRQGEQPNLIPLLIWNQRIGDYMTGSGSFTDDIAKAVTIAVADAISRRGIATARVLAQPDTNSERSLTNHCESSGMRWIVSGSINDLYATLHQKSYFFVIPTPWAVAGGWDNKKSDPLGVARFTIQVLDCKVGTEVLEREFSAESHYAQATLGEAAKRAMDEALQKLADSFHLAALGGPSPQGQADVPDQTYEESLAIVTGDDKELVEDRSAATELARVDLDLLPVTIKHDSRFPNSFGVAVVIDDHEEILLAPDSETTKQLSRGQHLIRIVDPEKGFLRKPDWVDYEFTLDLKSLSNPTILIESRGLFRVSITIKIYSEGNETVRYKIKTSW